MKCYNCENEATRKDYRTVDGITGKVITCEDCMCLNDVAIRDRYAEIQKALKEHLNFDQVDEILDEAMAEFWDTVNNRVYDLEEEVSEDFKQDVGILPHDDTIEKWRDDYFDLIQSKLKKQL